MEEGKKSSSSLSLYPSLWIQLLGFICINGLFCTAIGSSLFVLIHLFRYTNTAITLYCIIPYLTYTQCVPILLRQKRDEYTGHKRWKFFSQYFPIFILFRKFLQLNVITPLPKELTTTNKNEDDDDDDESNTQQQQQQFIFGVFPHGVSSDYRILLDGMLYDLLPNLDSILTLSASILFRLPLVRELSLWTGCVDASRHVAEQILATNTSTNTNTIAKSSLLILPGGEAEQIRTMQGRERVYLQSRKGFIKLAMRYRVPVVPVYVFGVSDAYNTYYNHHPTFWYKARYWLMQTFGICLPIGFGFYLSPFCPIPLKHTIVFGKPIPVYNIMKKHNTNDDDDGKDENGDSSHRTTTTSPTSEELDLAHDQFCIALRQLFDEHKFKLGYGDRELEIV